jgi:hypothetical protein
MKQKDNADRDDRYAAWVGFDWGDQEHVWALQWTDSGSEGAWSKRQKHWTFGSVS